MTSPYVHCKGSWLLGTACGACNSCYEGAVSLIPELLSKDRGRTNEHNMLVRENRDQATRIAELEGILAQQTKASTALIERNRQVETALDDIHTQGVAGPCREGEPDPPWVMVPKVEWDQAFERANLEEAEKEAVMIRFPTEDVELLSYAVSDLHAKLEWLSANGWTNDPQLERLQRLQLTLEQELDSRSRRSGWKDCVSCKGKGSMSLGGPFSEALCPACSGHGRVPNPSRL